MAGFKLRGEAENRRGEVGVVNVENSGQIQWPLGSKMQRTGISATASCFVLPKKQQKWRVQGRKPMALSKNNFTD